MLDVVLGLVLHGCQVFLPPLRSRRQLELYCIQPPNSLSTKLTSSGLLGLVLHGGQVLGGVGLLDGHGLLGVLELALERGALGSDGLLQVGQSLGAFRVAVLDGLDLVGDAAGNHALLLHRLLGGLQFLRGRRRRRKREG